MGEAGSSGAWNCGVMCLNSLPNRSLAVSRQKRVLEGRLAQIKKTAYGETT